MDNVMMFISLLSDSDWHKIAMSGVGGMIGALVPLALALSWKGVCGSVRLTAWSLKRLYYVVKPAPPKPKPLGVVCQSIISALEYYWSHDKCSLREDSVTLGPVTIKFTSLTGSDLLPRLHEIKVKESLVSNMFEDHEKKVIVNQVTPIVRALQSRERAARENRLISDLVPISTKLLTPPEACSEPTHISFPVLHSSVDGQRRVQ